MPVSAFMRSAKATRASAWPTRSALYAPWPSPESTLPPVAPEPPLDLKWLVIATNSVPAAPSDVPSAARNSCAIGSRALSKFVWSSRITDSPTGVTSAGW